MEDFETAEYEQLKRKVDRQIEESHRYEDLALSLLRIILTGILVIATALSVVASTGLSDRFVFSFFRRRVDRLPEKVLSSEIPVPTAETVVTLIMVCSALLLILSLLSLLAVVPAKAYQTILPSGLESAPTSRHPSRDELLESYESLIKQNEEIVSEKRRSLKLCLRFLKEGIAAFCFSAIAVVIIVFLQNAVVILYTFVALVGLVFGFALRITTPEQRDFVRIRHRWTDLAMIVSTLVLTATLHFPTSPWGDFPFLLITLFLVITISLFALRVDFWTLQRQIARNIFLFIAFSAGLLVLVQGTPPEIEGKIAILLSTLLMAAFTLLIATSTQIFIWTLRGLLREFVNFVGDKLRNWPWTW